MSLPQRAGWAATSHAMHVATGMHMSLIDESAWAGVGARCHLPALELWMTSALLLLCLPKKLPATSPAQSNVPLSSYHTHRARTCNCMLVDVEDGRVTSRECHAGRLAKGQCGCGVARRSVEKRKRSSTPPPRPKAAPHPLACQGVSGDAGVRVSVVHGLCRKAKEQEQDVFVCLRRWRVERKRSNSSDRGPGSNARADLTHHPSPPHTSLHLLDRYIWPLQAWEEAERAWFGAARASTAPKSRSNCTHYPTSLLDLMMLRRPAPTSTSHDAHVHLHTYKQGEPLFIAIENQEQR